jgi:hypothetical protein
MTPDALPNFEGHPVEGTALVIKSSTMAHQELDDIVVGIDDVVQMLSQFRVVDVQHKIDERTGKLIRVQVLKPVDVVLAPIDPSDPNDRGIIRALPRPRINDA